MSLGVVFAGLLMHAETARTQDLSPPPPLNLLSVSGEFSHTSSHILEGVSRRRKLGQLTLAYDHRLFSNRSLAFFYELGVTPVAFLQDPLEKVTINSVGKPPLIFGPTPHLTICVPQTFSTHYFTSVVSCSTRWTYGGGFSPLGFSLKILQAHRIHLIFGGNGGLTFTTRQEPIDYAKALNYQGQLGGGLEFNSHGSSTWALEYRLYHLSNGATADTNPGIDGQMVGLTYSFRPRNLANRP